MLQPSSSPGLWPADWLVPDWPAPSQVRAVFTSRAGGVSQAPFDTLNLGDHVGDVPAHVAANRAVLQRTSGTRAVFLKQTHGFHTLAIAPHSPDAQEADASVTAQPGLACTVMVADCLPVLLCTAQGDVVAAAHAGWRGLAGDGQANSGGILASAYASFSALAQQTRAQSAIETIAWLGPCIGPAAFEVGAEVKAAFEAVLPQASHCFRAVGAAAPGKFWAHLPALARLRLRALGIERIYGNDGSASWCTVGNPDRFFSHRRDAGIHGNGLHTTGRMAASIWIAQR